METSLHWRNRRYPLPTEFDFVSRFEFASKVKPLDPRGSGRKPLLQEPRGAKPEGEKV
jgi:hypothetical protein